MTGINEASEEAQHWRNKYADKLSELDTLEQTAIEKIDQLRKALLVVNLACQGLHPSLDAELSRFKKALHGENLSLDIARPLTTLQEVAEPVIESDYRQQILSALETALDPFNDLALDKQSNKSVKQFRKQIKQQNPSYSEIPQTIERFADLVSKLLSAIGSEELAPDATKEPTKGLWQRLFGSGEEDENEAENLPLHTGSTADDISEGEVSEENKPADLLTSTEAEDKPFEQNSQTKRIVINDEQPAAAAASQAQHQGQLDSLEQKFTTVIDHVGECILAVLRQLPIPEAVVSDSQSLKNKIEKGLTWFEIIPSLETLTVIVLATIGDIKEEFEHYLKTLNERLHVFQASAVEAQTGYQQALESADKYNQIMKNDLGELQSSVEQATDIEDLKQVVSSQLDKVLESLESQHGQLEKPESLTDQLTQLVQRVSQMEAQIQELESSLSKEREKALRDALTGIANRQAYDSIPKFF